MPPRPDHDSSLGLEFDPIGVPFERSAAEPLPVFSLDSEAPLPFDISAEAALPAWRESQEGLREPAARSPDPQTADRRRGEAVTPEQAPARADQRRARRFGAFSLCWCHARRLGA